MKFFYVSIVLVFVVGCTSVASVNWVQRAGGDDRSDTWIPECSNCGHVVNYKATQCSNPKDLSLIVWRDKDLFFDFPDDPQNDYTDEQLENKQPVQNEIKSEDVIKHIEEDENGIAVENTITKETNTDIKKEDITEEMKSDFADLDWEEDSEFESEEKDSSNSKTQENKNTDDPANNFDTDFDDIDW